MSVSLPIVPVYANRIVCVISFMIQSIQVRPVTVTVPPSALITVSTTMARIRVIVTIFSSKGLSMMEFNHSITFKQI